MASCVPLNCGIKFSKQQIDRFSDRVKNILEENNCRKLYKKFLEETGDRRKRVVLEFWERARNDNFENEDEIDDYLLEIDGFNDGPMLTMSEHGQKLSYIQEECARILQKGKKAHENFIKYLEKNHMQ